MIRKQIESVRKEMEKAGLDLWYDSGTDPHLGEYIPLHWHTREWLTGFTGSAGIVLITKDFSGLWTDFRYYLQAEKELENSGIHLLRTGEKSVPTPEEWIINHLPEKSAIGFNGKCLTAGKIENWKKVFSDKKYSFCGDKDLINSIWTDRPELPQKPVFRYEQIYAGEGSPQKIERIRQELYKKHADAVFLTLLDEIAWIFNIRGHDVAYNPVVVSFAWIDREQAIFFVDREKISESVRCDLKNEGIDCKPYAEADDFLKNTLINKSVLTDKDRISYYHYDLIKSLALKTIESENPSYHFKSIKNETEQAGIRNAHIRDGAAMVRWMIWLEKTIQQKNETEITIADELENIRSQQKYYHGLSFSTIVGYEEHGAIVHYSAKPETASVVEPKGILLVDSGAQYLDGTTDITRTLALCEPTVEQKEHFTLVLKGMIGLARAVFPEGTSGSNLDVLARQYLWKNGLNYGHGTGHGVGCFLNVHEGPQRISLNSAVPLKPGMLLSNEPGVYFEGKYGIRIENLILCKKSTLEGFLDFETITLCPIHINLIFPELLTPDEKSWLNTYHQIVFEKLSPMLDNDERVWLKENTKAVF